MKTSVVFMVLGGDRRMRACADGLRSLGYPVCDLPSPNFDTFTSQIKGTNVLILPIPALSGECINGTSLQVQQVLSAVPPATAVFAGVIPTDLKMRIVDYNLDEAFQQAGAIATAEGAISILIQELPITLHGATALIIGNGRIGKALSERLTALGMKVTVSARKEQDWQDIAEKNLRTDHTGVYNHGLDYHCIINTVPAPVLSKVQLALVPKSCLLLDLASRPGGLDWQACEELELRAIHALALPGKTSPNSSGLAIRDTVLDLLNLR
ncbi:MAG: hypothetical protein E7449_01485 [Ruminococcaceae bacterium]|nr:hypothetical protein [Oscillospiraceae bacterium]